MQLPAAPYKGHWLENDLLMQSPYNPVFNQFPNLYRSPKKSKKKMRGAEVESVPSVGKTTESIFPLEEPEEEASDVSIAAQLVQNLYRTYSETFESAGPRRLKPGEGMSSPEHSKSPVLFRVEGTSPSKRLQKMDKKMKEFQQQKANIMAHRALLPMYKKQISKFVSANQEPMAPKSRTYNLQDSYEAFEAKMRESEALATKLAKRKDLTMDLRLLHHTFAQEPDVAPVLLFAHLPPLIPNVNLEHKA